MATKKDHTERADKMLTEVFSLLYEENIDTNKLMIASFILLMVRQLDEEQLNFAKLIFSAVVGEDKKPPRKIIKKKITKK